MLDVKLQVGADTVDSPRFGKPLEVEAGRRHRRVHAPLAPVVEIEIAYERTAAEHPGLEAASLLVVERDNPERTLESNAFLPERTHALEGGQHAQCAVEAPAPRHCVQVRADEDSGSLTLLPAPDHVAGRVDLGLEPKRIKPGQEPFVRLRELRGPGKAGDAVFVGADPRRVFEFSDERGHRVS